MLQNPTTVYYVLPQPQLLYIAYRNTEVDGRHSIAFLIKQRRHPGRRFANKFAPIVGQLRDCCQTRNKLVPAGAI